MKKTLYISLFLLLLALPSAAQVKIAYYSHSAVLESMSEYKIAMIDLEGLRKQFNEETQHADEEFNAKYEEFMDNYGSLATTIRRKRQTELQQTMEANVRFREESQRLLRQAENDAMHRINKKLNAVIGALASDEGYDVVLNTDSDACPYLNPAISEDITSKLINLLK